MTRDEPSPRLRARQLDQVYGAIADPTRRAIVSMLANGDANVGTLAGRFSMSLNGVSKHVKVLERAGLVARTVRGREHLLQLRPDPLRGAARWIAHYRAFWNTRIDALEDFLISRERQDTRKSHRSGRPGR
jgi:DNA-binding transcriptional ArsR family regulator